jgi:hypothetical protein
MLPFAQSSQSHPMGPAGKNPEIANQRGEPLVTRRMIENYLIALPFIAVFFGLTHIKARPYGRNAESPERTHRWFSSTARR